MDPNALWKYKYLRLNLMVLLLLLLLTLLFSSGCDTIIQKRYRMVFPFYDKNVYTKAQHIHTLHHKSVPHTHTNQNYYENVIHSWMLFYVVMLLIFVILLKSIQKKNNENSVFVDAVFFPDCHFPSHEYIWYVVTNTRFCVTCERKKTWNEREKKKYLDAIYVNVISNTQNRPNKWHTAEIMSTKIEVNL